MHIVSKTINGTSSQPAPAEPLYRIGAVARLTGISPVTIRAWERRYDMIKPRRTDSGSRLYSREDIARLALIKRLVDAGNAVGVVARQSLQELQRQLRVYESSTLAVPAGAAAPDPCRAAVLGDALPALLALHETELPELDLMVVHRDRRQFEEAVAGLGPDLIIVEFPTVQEGTAAEVEALRQRAAADRVLVVYGFGPRQAVARLNRDRILTLRAPVGIPELRRACLHRGAPPDRPAARDPRPPPRRYDNAALGRIAAAATAVHCECPHHLVDLVRSLVAFETYSAECRHRNPGDAALHGYLQTVSAQARSALEEALARVVAADKLQL